MNSFHPRAKIDILQNALENIYATSFESQSLFNGESGACLLAREVIASDLDFSIRSKSLKFTNNSCGRLLDCLTSSKMSMNFAEGIGGIGYTLQLMHESSLFDHRGLNGLLSEIDACQFEWAQHCFSSKIYDLLYGGCGALLYLCKRSESQPQILKQISELITLIENSAERSSESELMWVDNLTPMVRQEEANDESVLYTLGLAHGVSSIISILIKIHSLGVMKAKTEHMIIRAANWLNKCRQPDTFYSCFPVHLGTKNAVSESRLAWCHGDLGIANTFWLVGQYLGLQYWKNISLEIIDKTLCRRDQNNTQLIDSCLCHGTLGVAYMYKLFYHRTGNNKYCDAMNYWFNKAFSNKLSNLGKSGFPTYNAEKKCWEHKLGLIEGNVGMCLGILGCLFPQKEVHWDKILLMTI